MGIEWIKDKNNPIPERTIETLNGRREISGNAVAFGMDEISELSDYTPLIAAAVKFPRNIPDIVRPALVLAALRDTSDLDTITANNILPKIDTQVIQYQKTSGRKFTLIADISVMASDAAVRFVERSGTQSTIFIVREIPRKFRASRDTYVKRTCELHRCDPAPENYSIVSGHVSARTPKEALPMALDLLDTLRGLWNFLLLYDTSRIYSAGMPEPVNLVRLGSFHSIHNSLSGAAYDENWAEPSFPLAKLTSLDPKGNASFGRFRSTRLVINRHKFGSFINEALKRYCRALDYQDYDASFIKMWGLLEYLTQSVGDRYDITIKRSSALWSDDFALEILGYLRQIRNGVVHNGFSADSDQIRLCNLEHIRRFVDELLLFYIRDGRHFERKEEIRDFLNLSRNTRAIEREINIRKLVFKYRAPIAST